MLKRVVQHQQVRKQSCRQMCIDGAMVKIGEHSSVIESRHETLVHYVVSHLPQWIANGMAVKSVPETRKKFKKQ